jgi:hypothetical protein
VADDAKKKSLSDMGVFTHLLASLAGFGVGYLAFSRGYLDKGLAKRRGFTYEDFPRRDLETGTNVEMEHTRFPSLAKRIALDHLVEDENYYRKRGRMTREEE